MSREVEVTGINMTAAVPQNVQISLGNDMSTGFLDAEANSTSHRLTSVVVPGTADADPDWSNFVVVSDYYQFGRLAPATSTNGLNMWFTKQATGAGKTLAGQTLNADGRTTDGTGDISAKFYDASNFTGFAGGEDATTLTAATFVKAEGSATMGADYDLYADGENEYAYYIDIPVWFRTSAQSDIELAVQATVKGPGITSAGRDAFTSNEEGSRDNDETEDLYRAVRVSVLKGTDTGTGDAAVATIKGTENTGVQGVIYNSAQVTGDDSETYQSKYYSEVTNQRPSGSLGTPHTVTGAVTTAGATFGDISGWSAVQKITEFGADTNGDGYANETQNARQEDETAGTKTDPTSIVTVTAPVADGSGNKNQYGAACRYTIRVWIDGEDVNCWNATAGQDFTVGLKFMQTASGNA